MWPGGKVGHQFAPPDQPPCGFFGELCKEEKGSDVSLRNRFRFVFGFVVLFGIDFILWTCPCRDVMTIALGSSAHG